MAAAAHHGGGGHAVAAAAAASVCPVKVVVRCRPLGGKEAESCLEAEGRQVHVIGGAAELSFAFDAVFDGATSTRAVYDGTCVDLVGSVLEGFNATIFAYGQTGSGKTYTMQGRRIDEAEGLIPCALEQIFAAMATTQKGDVEMGAPPPVGPLGGEDDDAGDVEYVATCECCEIYNEDIRDLGSLAAGPQQPQAPSQGSSSSSSSSSCSATTAKRCELREDPARGVFVEGLASRRTRTLEQATDFIAAALRHRSTAATLMNDASSRSHCIFTVRVEARSASTVRRGKLNFVDLAGSERQSKTGATGQRLRESTRINLSLTALGRVISALVDKKRVPYRDSKLTRLLQDSLGGNTRTLMLAAVSPAATHRDETLSTLRYADRAKSIQNRPRVNEDPRDVLLREYRDEIQRLQILLQQQSSSNIFGVETTCPAPPAARPAASCSSWGKPLPTHGASSSKNLLGGAMDALQREMNDDMRARIAAYEVAMADAANWEAARSTTRAGRPPQKDAATPLGKKKKKNASAASPATVLFREEFLRAEAFVRHAASVLVDAPAGAFRFTVQVAPAWRTSPTDLTISPLRRGVGVLVELRTRGKINTVEEEEEEEEKEEAYGHKELWSFDRFEAAVARMNTTGQTFLQAARAPPPASSSSSSSSTSSSETHDLAAATTTFGVSTVHLAALTHLIDIDGTTPIFDPKDGGAVAGALRVRLRVEAAASLVADANPPGAARAKLDDFCGHDVDVHLELEATGIRRREGLVHATCALFDQKTTTQRSMIRARAGSDPATEVQLRHSHKFRFLVTPALARYFTQAALLIDLRFASIITDPTAGSNDS